MSKEISTASKF